MFAYSRKRIKPKAEATSVKGRRRLGLFILSFSLKKEAEFVFEMVGCELIRIIQV